MEVVQFKRRKKKQNEEISITGSSSLSTACGIPVSSASIDFSAVSGNGFLVSDSVSPDNDILNENGGKCMPSSSIKCFSKTYQRRKCLSSKSVCEDGLYLLAEAADGAVLSTKTQLEEDDQSKESEILMEGSHRKLNSELLRRLKVYAEKKGCEIGEGWTARHNLCNLSGKHRYYHSPSGLRFSSKSEAVKHELKLKEGEILPKLKEKRRNGISCLTVCPHSESIEIVREDSQKRDDYEGNGIQKNGGERGNDDFQLLELEIHGEKVLQSQAEPFEEASKSQKSCLCKVCQMDSDGDKILICDGCEAAYHVHCLLLNVDDIPTGSWFCASCSESGRVSSKLNLCNIPKFGGGSSRADDQCVSCSRTEGNNLQADCPACRKIQEGPEKIQHHCSVCERIYQSSRQKDVIVHRVKRRKKVRERDHNKKIQHHCAVCEKLYHISVQHYKEMTRKQNKASTKVREDSTVSDFANTQTESQFGACRRCRTGNMNDKGMAMCANDYCPWYWHISCLNPPLTELPPAGWYCPSCICRTCLVNEKDDQIVLCDGCDDGYHIYCMKPPLETIPEGNWYCCACEGKKNSQARMDVQACQRT